MNDKVILKTLQTPNIPVPYLFPVRLDIVQRFAILRKGSDMAVLYVTRHPIPIDAYTEWSYCALDDCDCSLPKVCFGEDEECSRILACESNTCDCHRLKVCPYPHCECHRPKVVTKTFGSPINHEMPDFPVVRQY